MPHGEELDKLWNYPLSNEKQEDLFGLMWIVVRNK